MLKPLYFVFTQPIFQENYKKTLLKLLQVKESNATLIIENNTKKANSINYCSCIIIENVIHTK